MMDAASIQTSPILKDMLINALRLPLVISMITPVRTRRMPAIFLMLKDSLYINRDRMMTKIGKVMAIRERFKAVVVRPAK